MLLHSSVKQPACISNVVLTVLTELIVYSYYLQIISFLTSCRNLKISSERAQSTSCHAKTATCSYKSIRCFSPCALNVILRNSSPSYRQSCHTDLWPMHQDGKYSILVRWVVVGTKVKAEVGVSGLMAYRISNLCTGRESGHLFPSSWRTGCSTEHCSGGQERLSAYLVCAAR
jgi:hypothetical protein